MQKRITNNTSYNITLINGKVIKRYGTIIIENPSYELNKQLENLKNNGFIQVVSL